MTIHLPPHQLERLDGILTSIHITNMQTSIKKWHKVLVELSSMPLAFHDDQNLFSQIQIEHALTKKIRGRVTLSKGVYQTLEDFH